MKYRTTKKDIMNGCADVISLGYGAVQNLFNAVGEAEAYTCGVYGWNADIYRGTNPGQVIVTGYRPFGRKAKLSYGEVRAFDRKADSIYHDWNRPYEDRKSDIETLYKEFCERI